MDIKQQLTTQYLLLQHLRDFFCTRGYLDVLTPPMVENPGMETHLHPFQVYGVQDGSFHQFLHTSPEFSMKYLLSIGLEKIFQIAYCFRHEPSSSIHRSQFLMLEWYQAHADYQLLMVETWDLINWCYQALEQQPATLALASSWQQASFQRATIQEIFQEFLNFDLLQMLEVKDLAHFIATNFSDIPLPPADGKLLEWEDYFFLLFLNKIEPQLVNFPFLLLYEYPYHLSALARIKPQDSRVCERFEVYCSGIELCNCFHEVTQLQTLTDRFTEQRERKWQQYHYRLPWPQQFLHAFQRPFPASSGNALGVERLLMILTGQRNLFYPFT